MSGVEEISNRLTVSHQFMPGGRNTKKESENERQGKGWEDERNIVGYEDVGTGRRQHQERRKLNEGSRWSGKDSTDSAEQD